jgi:hypothetical protein
VAPTDADKRIRDANDQTPESFGLTLAAIIVSRTPNRVAPKKSGSRQGGKTDRQKGSI